MKSPSVGSAFILLFLSPPSFCCFSSRFLTRTPQQVSI